MDIVERIKNNFNKGFFGKGMLIPELPEEFPAWTFKQNDWVAVAVPINTYVPFSEAFSQVRISTSKRVCIGDTEYNILMLQCFAMDSRNEFAAMCKQFVDPGPDGQLRKKLIEEPTEWWKNWKDMLGNVSSDRAPYDILGELIVVEQQLLAGKNPVWAGIDHATNDVEMDDSSIERKSDLICFRRVSAAENREANIQKLLMRFFRNIRLRFFCMIAFNTPTIAGIVFFLR